MSTHLLHNEAELFRQLTEGDENAFREIFNHYFPLVVAFTIKITHTQHTAEEIAQEVFLRLWKKRDQFQQTAVLGPWLYRVAANLAFDHLKKMAHQNKLIQHIASQPAAHEAADAQINYRQSKSLVDATIQNLPEQQRLIYKLSREEGLSHQEIAGRLNLSVNTVKNHMVRALQTIREAIRKAMHLFFSTLF